MRHLSPASGGGRRRPVIQRPKELYTSAFVLVNELIRIFFEIFLLVLGALVQRGYLSARKIPSCGSSPVGTSCGWGLLTFSSPCGVFEPIALAIGFDHMAPMGQPVEGGAGQDMTAGCVSQK